MLDTWFVGKLPGAALKAHGAGMNVIFMVFSLMMTVSVASTALVSRSFGAGEKQTLQVANRQCLSTGVWLGLALMLLTWVTTTFAPAIFLPGDLQAQKNLIQYLMWFGGALPFLVIVQVLAGSMRGVGDTVSPMIISGVQIFFHAALNYFMIFPNRTEVIFGNVVQVPGANLGLAGGAAGLLFSSVFSMIIYLNWSRRTEVGSPKFPLLPDREWLRRIMNIAVPAAGQAVLRVLSFTAFTLILSRTPTSDVALGALRVGIAIESIMFMPAFGLSMSAATLVGQNLGAKRPEQAARMGWLTSHYGAITILLLSIPLFIFAPAVASFLTGGDKPQMAAEAASYIRILISTEVLFGYAMVLIGAMQGAGDTKRTMRITLVSLWLVRVPLALLLAFPFGLGSIGCYIAMSGSQAIQGLMAMAEWKRGQWKTVKV